MGSVQIVLWHSFTASRKLHQFPDPCVDNERFGDARTRKAVSAAEAKHAEAAIQYPLPDQKAECSVTSLYNRAFFANQP